MPKYALLHIPLGEKATLAGILEGAFNRSLRHLNVTCTCFLHFSIAKGAWNDGRREFLAASFHSSSHGTGWFQPRLFCELANSHC
uniref:Uncharacterized protein n=1 Tax=Steinernema glaseri TaxID=37863 RepID=A0A1I8APH8_9BILA